MTAVSHNDGQSRKAFKSENDMHAATMPLTTFTEEIFFPHEFFARNAFNAKNLILTEIDRNTDSATNSREALL
eukprot:scaffold12492_cov36-Cyclotella_meneghiniana.AAC.6